MNSSHSMTAGGGGHITGEQLPQHDCEGGGASQVSSMTGAGWGEGGRGGGVADEGPPQHDCGGERGRGVGGTPSISCTNTPARWWPCRDSLHYKYT